MANSAFIIGAETGPGSVLAVVQAAHGFSVGDWLYRTATDYQLAVASTAVTAEVVGVVSAVPDVNNFSLQINGSVTGLIGIVSGDTYWLSEGVPGTITNIEPTTVGFILKELMTGIDTDAGIMLTHKGEVIGTPGGSGVAKGWVYYDQSFDTLQNNFNVAGASDDGVGLFTITWDVDFSTAFYGLAQTSGAAGSALNGLQTAGTVTCRTFNVSFGLADSANNGLVAFGDQ